MHYMIEALAPFHVNSVQRQPGIYRVPEDLTPEIAQRELKSGNAHKLGKTGAPENKAVMEAPENKGPLSLAPGKDKPLSSSPAGQVSHDMMQRPRGRPKASR